MEYVSFIRLTSLVEKELKEVKAPVKALEPVIEASEEAPRDINGRKRYRAHVDNELEKSAMSEVQIDQREYADKPAAQYFK